MDLTAVRDSVDHVKSLIAFAEEMEATLANNEARRQTLVGEIKTLVEQQASLKARLERETADSQAAHATTLSEQRALFDKEVERATDALTLLRKKGAEELADLRARMDQHRKQCSDEKAKWQHAAESARQEYTDVLVSLRKEVEDLTITRDRLKDELKGIHVRLGDLSKV